MLAATALREDCAELVLVGAVGAPHGRGHALQRRERGEGTAGRGEESLGRIRSLGLDARAEHERDIARVGECQVRLGEQAAQDRLRIASPARPQARPEIAVETDQDPGRARRPHGCERRIGAPLAERRSDA